MKHPLLVLSSVLLTAATTLGTGGQEVRYRDPSGWMSLTVSHDIEILENPSVEPGREFSFDLTFDADQGASTVSVTVERAKASYTAHGMKQRLTTRHLTGRSFPLTIRDGDRSLLLEAPSEPPEIDLGPQVSAGFSLGTALSEALPVLPRENVGVGSTWITERTVHVLHGWSWAQGRLTSRHRVTAVEREGDSTIITVLSEAEADLTGDAGTTELERTQRWTFDATAGRLLVMTMEQETTGITVVPQGRVPVRQQTRVELAPREVAP